MFCHMLYKKSTMVYDVKYKIKQNDGKKYISSENYLKFVLKGKEYVSLESKIRTYTLAKSVLTHYCGKHSTVNFF